MYSLPIPLPARRLWRLELGAYGASVLMPPSTQGSTSLTVILPSRLSGRVGPVIVVVVRLLFAFGSTVRKLMIPYYCVCFFTCLSVAPSRQSRLLVPDP